MGAGLSPIHSKIFVLAGNYNFFFFKFKFNKNDVCFKKKKSTNNCRVFCYVDTDDATHSRIAGFKLTLVSSNSGAGILKPTFSHHTDAQRGQKWGLVSIFVHFFISLFFQRILSFFADSSEPRWTDLLHHLPVIVSLQHLRQTQKRTKKGN